MDTGHQFQNNELYHNNRLFLQKARVDTELKNIIMLASLFIGRPIAIIDLALRHVGHYPDCELADDDWNSLIQTGSLRETYAMEIFLRKDKAYPDDAYNAYYAKASAAELEKYRASLFIGGRIMGGMMILADDSPFREDEGDYIELARLTIAEYMLMFYHSAHANRNQILEQLENQPTQEVVRNVLQLTGHDGAAPKNGFFAAFCRHGDDTEWYISLLSYVLASNYPGMLSTNGTDGYYYLIPLHRHSYAETCENIRLHMRTFPEYFAMSDPFTDLSMYSRHLAAARLAWQYAAVNVLPVKLQTVGTLRKELLLARLAGAEKNEALSHPDILLLRRHDEENNTRYCSILYEYLRCFHNLSTAADALFIHRNTLTYHMNNIKKLLSCDIEDPETSMLLWLSLCATQQ